MAQARGRGAALRLLRGLAAAVGVTLAGMLILAALVVWAGISDRTLTALNQALKVLAIVLGTVCAVGRGGRHGLAFGGCVGLIYIALGYGACALTGPMLVTGGMLTLEMVMGLALGGLCGAVTANLGRFAPVRSGK